jgi:UDP-glucose 4-epimerase
MRVLVTGGAGFIGSHIVEKLLVAGHEVAVVDNLTTGDLTHLSSEVPFFHTDIREDRLIKQCVQFRPEVIIHQAAQVDIPKSIREPLSDGTVNVMGTLNVLTAAVRSGARKIIYASSCAVYGEPMTDVLVEEHPIRPISLYGTSKWMGEIYLECFQRMFQLDYTILRYANVYGPRQGEKGEGGVISIFTRNMLAGSSPVIYGDGEQTRDFVFVKDVADANILALHAGSGQLFNVSTEKRTSIHLLYAQLQELAGKAIPALHQPERPGDIKHSCLSNRRAKEILGWQPRYSLSAGLKETIAYFQSKTA